MALQPGRSSLSGYREARRVAEASVAELARTLELIIRQVKPGSDRIALVDVIPMNWTRNFHNFGLETPAF